MVMATPGITSAACLPGEADAANVVATCELRCWCCSKRSHATATS